MSSSYARRDSGRGGPGRYVVDDDRAGSDSCTGSDTHGAEDGCFRADVDAVADDRGVVPATSHPEGYLVVESDVVADANGRVDDHAASTVR
jgi:hypothetical protein